jgi:galactokinase
MSDFQTLFGHTPAVKAEAPGRVNLIGEHTDYNGGFVLPTPIPQRTLVELAPRSDLLVRAWSAAVEGPQIREYRLGTETPAHDWLDYVQGVTAILNKEGCELRGFEVRVVSTVPLGSGLSSSASLTVSLMRALRSAFHLPLDDVRIALAGRRVENEFVGAQVGIMDPMVVSLAGAGSALFLDACSLTYEPVPLPADADLVVIHSGVAHRHAAGDYNTRRRECEQACARLGIRQLRELEIDDLGRVHALPEPLNRRARHVITENNRVRAAVTAMKIGDLVKLGELFYASHFSMRDDYEVSIPEIDRLVELARLDRDIYGARLTGGGFGGSIVLLARAGTGAAAAERLTRSYAECTGFRARVLVPA